VQFVFLMIGVTLATVGPYVAVMLRERGFEPATIGLVASISALGFTVAIPIWGHLADVTLGRPRTLQFAAIGSAAAMSAFGLPFPAILLGGSIVVYNVFQSAFTPVADALAITRVRDPTRDYSRIRLLSSLSYAVVVLAVGFLYTQVGYVFAPFLYAAGCLLLAAGLVWVAEPKGARLVIRHGRGGSARVALGVQPRLPIVLAALGLLYFGILGSYTFFNIRMVELGGTASELGIAAGIAAVAEIPAFLVAARIAARVGLRGLFSASAALYSLLILSWAFLPTPELLTISRIFTGIAFAGLAIAAVLTINVLLPLRLQATGQGLYQTISFGVAAMVANLVGGLIYQGVGPPALFIVMAAAGFAGAGLGWLVLPQTGERRAPELEEQAEDRPEPAPSPS
jgi:PPP family 3-phenylpropionic acid transporter